ncbi:MATE family efflux transporter [Treponema ruminis]|uniref:Multidrug-efflux transporter n=1 Tax=Treponema ruminis TaxID=744515 RepID=A0A7W8LLK3_9SPIR|nr:MATE family efflux transporter [Treponema ruminis]MBB5225470.1 putative MATE family efflux protein [Treponema ruminis]QSI01661.1 MATE family efflux transporter [Treponema ruminis]
MNVKLKEYKVYYSRLLAIAVPLILSNIINQLQMLIDRIFLGNANSLYMSVLGNANSPIWTTMSVCISIATGASILISQNVGAKNQENVEEYSGALLKFNNILPVMLFFLWGFGSVPVFRLMGVSENILPWCVDYARYSSPVFLLIGLGGSLMVIFQTSNHTKHLAIWSLLRSCLNIFFDWVLIFGRFGFPEMGVKGAALGTTLAEYLGALYMLVAYARSRKLSTRPKAPALKKAKFSSYLHSARLGINTALEDFCWNLGNLAIIRILNTINELAAGIFSIVFGVELLAVVVVGALGSGTLTLSSEAVGKGDAKQYKGVCLSAYSICFVIALIMVAASLAFPQEIISVFTKDERITTTSGIYLLFIAVNLFSKSGNIIVGSGIRGSGDTKWMFCTQIFGTVFVISCASLFVFALHLGVSGVFFAVMADEFVRFIINLAKYRKICRSSIPGPSSM